MTAGYYRFPTIHEDNVVFVSEDDLWSVSARGGTARRLTSNLGEVTYPMLSPDGKQLAFVGREEGGAEVYVMPAGGGRAQRLTYLSSNCRVLGWTEDGDSIIFASSYGQPVAREMAIFRIHAAQTNGGIEQLPLGPARSVAFGPNGQTVIGRNTGDPARWKRYRGGTAGHLWIDQRGDGNFERFLTNIQGNIASPMWIETAGGARLFFVSDHEGIGNLYSCRKDGTDLRRHTDHEDYYMRNPSSDGKRIAYHAGADLYVYDTVEDRDERIQVDCFSPRVQRNRKFVDAGRYMDGYALHPTGAAIALTTRGKVFAFYNHEGPVLQYGERDGVRYRHPTWLQDERHILMVTDETGEETLEIHSTEPNGEPRRLQGLDLGRIVSLKVAPAEDKVAISNHRHELLIVDLESGDLVSVDRSLHRNIGGFDWSPDGRWLAYSFGATSRTSEIRLYQLRSDAQTGEDSPAGEDDGEAPQETSRVTAEPDSIHTITLPVLHDVRPAFDPDGKYLYFLSYREFNPVYDGLHFDLGFPWGMRPYLITLSADLPNPFVPVPAAGEDDEGDHVDEDEEDEDANDDDDDGNDADDDWDDDDLLEDEDAVHLSAAYRGDVTRVTEGVGGNDSDDNAKKGEGDKARSTKKRGEGKQIRVDLDGIDRRVIPFPVPDARYSQIAGIPNKALFTVYELHGQLDGDHDWDEDDAPGAGSLRSYDFKEYKSDTLAENVGSFELSANRKKLLYRTGSQLRVIAAGEKAPTASGNPRKTGWISLQRVKVSVDPQSEWEQMFREAWRLQRDHFWTEDMSQVDWQIVYHRYFPLIERVSTRSEFSDLMWEMQGELGTSHAYEFGGDYRQRPFYGQGFLGAELTWDGAAGGYKVGQLVLGDPWDAKANSPLATPGVDVQPGDVIVGINGQALNQDLSPAQLLVNQAGSEVLLSLAPRSIEEREPVADEGSADRKPHREDGDEKPPRLRSVIVRTIHSEDRAGYRFWVEQNRKRVIDATGGRVGYIHIPDMGAYGYAEFHRGYLAELDRDALIVDVRYNGGGHVSQLILEKLARRRLGYDLSRWGGLIPYPVESVVGPLVALTNEHAGSDGDIFCHSFKLMKLGPLVGKRTWGGVIGISPRHALVDGTITTQPEYSFWFEDVGWNVENYGTEPDIDVDITPQDFVAGKDSQLQRAVDEAIRLLELTPVQKPELEPRPSRALPKLPPRT